MLHTQHLEKNFLDLLNKLMSDPVLASTRLVGGTALTLTLGHRKCNDIDLFVGASTPINGFLLREHLDSKYRVKELITSSDSAFAIIDGIKVDIFRAGFDFIKPPVNVQSFRMASLPELGAMKLFGIYHERNKLSDFVDLAYMSSKVNYTQIVSSFNQMYSVDIKEVSNKMLKANLNSERFEGEIKLINGKLDVGTIKNRLDNMVLSVIAGI